MNLIVGLGNPGPKYATTRHNIGFMVIDRVLKELVQGSSAWESSKTFNALFYKKGDLIFAKPQTFMNASGMAVKKIVDLYKVNIDYLWVIHDDIDLPLGKIRIRVGGGTAGHHGVESIIKELGGKDQFVRFRLGVGKGKLEEIHSSNQNLHRHSVEKYVVSEFSSHEAGELRKLIKHAASAVTKSLQQGLDKTMNQFN